MANNTKDLKKYIVLETKPVKFEDIAGLPTPQVPPPEPAPCAVPLQDMNYVIRMQGQQLGIAAFAFFTDCGVMMGHLKKISQGQLPLYEMIDNRTGGVLYTTGDPS